MSLAREATGGGSNTSTGDAQNSSMAALTMALLGSGEFEPWSQELELALLGQARPGKVLILPTASALEGDAVFQAWGDKGLAHYSRLGIEAEVVPLKTRLDAENEGICAKLKDASLIFFSGGNPAHLAETLAGTPFWQALAFALADGAAYAGCSAGAVALGERAIDSTAREFTTAAWRPGLGLLPGVCVGAHWNALDSYVPGLRDFFIRAVPSGAVLLTIDESTAVLGDGEEWTVLGAGTARLLQGGAWSEFRAGQSFSFPPRIFRYGTN
jgi:cyanophycinase